MQQHGGSQWVVISRLYTQGFPCPCTHHFTRKGGGAANLHSNARSLQCIGAHADWCMEHDRWMAHADHCMEHDSCVAHTNCCAVHDSCMACVDTHVHNGCTAHSDCCVKYDGHAAHTDSHTQHDRHKVHTDHCAESDWCMAHAGTCQLPHRAQPPQGA
jgi:hypothetical protein